MDSEDFFVAVMCFILFLGLIKCAEILIWIGGHIHIVIK